MFIRVAFVITRRTGRYQVHPRVGGNFYALGDPSHALAHPCRILSAPSVDSPAPAKLHTAQAEADEIQPSTTTDILNWGIVNIAEFPIQNTFPEHVQ